MKKVAGVLWTRKVRPFIRPAVPRVATLEPHDARASIPPSKPRSPSRQRFRRALLRELRPRQTTRFASRDRPARHPRSQARARQRAVGRRGRETAPKFVRATHRGPSAPRFRGVADSPRKPARHKFRPQPGAARRRQKFRPIPSASAASPSFHRCEPAWFSSRRRAVPGRSPEPFS